MTFYLSQINSIWKETKTDKSEENIGEFGKFITQPNIYNYKSLISYYIDYIRKPQKLIKDTENYYVAEDIQTGTKYVCYKNLMMIDIDFYKKKSLCNILNQLIDFTNSSDEKYLFRVYKSNNGLHIFCLSHFLEHDDDNSIELMFNLSSDCHYALFSYIRGYCVRISPKKEQGKINYKFLLDIGNGKILKQLEKLCNIHLKLSKKTKQE